MTPEYILRASLCRPAHCYSSHVPGKGYVDNGNDPATKADYDRRRRRSAESEIENMAYAPGYAEPGYTDPEKGVLFADWNVFPSEAMDLLEKAGYAVEWSDEWATCSDCGKAFRTQADSYSWTPHYVLVNDCEIVCLDCLDWADVIGDYVNNADKALPPDVNVSALGFTRLEGDYASGWYGQRDDPAAILATLTAERDREIVFQLSGVGQFETRFIVWERPAKD